MTVSGRTTSTRDSRWPAVDTLRGEPPEIWPFPGSYLLAEAVDTVGADLYIHGHAHAGAEQGMTAGGISVRNVAQPVLRRPYALYRVGATVGDIVGDTVDHDDV